MRKEETLEHYRKVVKGKYGEYYERLNPYVLKQKPFLAGEIRKLFDDLLPKDVDSIVDLGCGAAWYFPILCEYADNIIGVDISEDLLQLAEALSEEMELKNVTFKHCKGAKLPFDDDSLSCIFEWDTLHHVEDIDAILDEIKRVLKPGGMFVGVEPNVFNFLMTVYHARRRHENRALVINRIHLKTLLSKRFDHVEILSNNTVVSYNSDFYQNIINVIDFMFTKVPLLKMFSLRYLFKVKK